MMGKIKRPSAQAYIKKNAMTTATQSGVIIPFHTLFKRGNSPYPKPPATWLTPR